MTRAILSELREKRTRITRAIELLEANPRRRSAGPGKYGRPFDLPTAKAIGRRHAHGHHMRYIAGCRCRRCREAIRIRNEELARNVELYGPNDLVPVAKVKAHLRYLKQFGIGHKTVALHAKVSKTMLAEILWYGRKKMRRRGANRVLAIQPCLEVLPRNTNIPAAETVAKINQLTRWGYSKRFITHAMGNRSGGLQIRSLKGKKAHVIARTAIKIDALFKLITGMRQAWMREHGRIPAKQYVYWKQRRGRKPVQPTAQSLALFPFPNNHDFFYVYPDELKQVMLLTNRARREVRRRNDGEKPDVGPEGSPVRGSRGAEGHREAA